jgi:hypothetical protein
MKIIQLNFSDINFSDILSRVYRPRPASALHAILHPFRRFASIFMARSWRDRQSPDGLLIKKSSGRVFKMLGVRRRGI